MKLFIVISIVLTCTTAFAFDSFDSMMCNNGVASVGDSSETVIEKCGAPTRTRSGTRVIKSAGRSYFGNEWVYDLGPTQFIQVAVFGSGRVIKFYSEREAGTAKR